MYIEFHFFTTITVQFSRSLRVYSSIYAGKPVLEHADKIILPEACLADLHYFMTSGSFDPKSNLLLQPFEHILID